MNEELIDQCAEVQAEIRDVRNSELSEWGKQFRISILECRLNNLADRILASHESIFVAGSVGCKQMERTV